MGDKQMRSNVYPSEERLEQIIDKGVAIAVTKAQEGKSLVRHGTNPDLEIQTSALREEVKDYVKENLYWYTCDTVKTDEECSERLQAFFDRVLTTGEIPTIEKLILCLGIHQDTFRRWKNGIGISPRRAWMVKKAVTTIQAIETSLVQHRKIPETTYIFRAKNYYDMQDTVEVVTVPKSDFEMSSVEDMRKKYMEQVGITDDTAS